MSLQCTECKRVFSVKSNLTRHLRMVHNIEIERIDILPGDFDTYHYKCLEGCKISFKYNRDLRKHLRTKHEVNVVELNLEFPNVEEFDKWLHNEEANSHVQYVHLTATKRKTTGAETYYYECSRTGKRSYVDDTVRKRRARKWLTKLNRGCTSQIIANKFHDGSYCVTYYKTHYGHDISVEHVKLSKQDRGAIASKLLLGLPVSTVLHSAKATAGDSVKRINLLARKDIGNIRRAFNIDLKDGKIANSDCTVNLFLSECYSHEYNPVLYSSMHDSPESEDINFIIMSKYQGEMLKEAGNNIVVLSSISLKNCDFDLITLFAVGESCESFPAACMYSNRAALETYELFFSKIKERVGFIAPKILYTNCEEMYYEAWLSVMGDVSHVLYTPAQIEIDWKSNLNRIVCNETEVTKIKRQWVYDTIKSLQNINEESDFFENFNATAKVLQEDEDFTDFVQYFFKNYSDPKKWVDCFKVGLDLPNKQLQMSSEVLRQYLNEDIEVRFDKIFHSLVRFIRDETVNFMLHTKTKRAFFINENDTRHSLLAEGNFNGTHLGENLWNVTEENLGTTHVVQKFLEEKCCNLICTTCRICLHCFSCSCVDFFIGNAICVHIHYIWVTCCQSVIQEDVASGDDQPNCDEEIIIEFDDSQEESDQMEDIQALRGAIAERTTVLCANVAKIENKNTLNVILGTLNQVCDLGQTEEAKNDTNDSASLGDHSYL